jgi:hypothetical protein
MMLVSDISFRVIHDIKWEIIVSGGLERMPKEVLKASFLLTTLTCKVKGKVHPCTGTEALYRPYGS